MREICTEVKMRRIILAPALFVGSVGLASAQGVGIDVGPRGGVTSDQDVTIITTGAGEP